MPQLFQSQDYKVFLNSKLDELDQGGRGARARMSRVIGCQTAYTAQVLRSSAHFSLEQTERINEFLGHTEEEGHFLLLLVQLAKSGTPALKARFQKQIQTIQQQRSVLGNRLDIKENLAHQDQVLYYSSWIYAAIHALVSVPGYQSLEKISRRLGIGLKTSGEALEFLLRSGLIHRNKKNEIEIGKSQIHLGVDSPLISKHHTNWRLQAIRSIEKDSKEGLHYSSALSISKQDADVIKEEIIKLLKQLKPIIRNSKEEEVYCLSFDFFTL